MDEVGRGALAGPVVVGVATYPEQEEYYLRQELSRVLRTAPKDSKKLSPKARLRGADFLRAQIVWSIGAASAGEIDELGIVAATTLAAGRALKDLSVLPSRLLVDAGLFHPYEDSVPTRRFVKGDELYLPIMAASIIAKEERDRYMVALATSYAGYGWERNAGYGSAAHRQAVLTYGPTEHHRRTFLKNQVDVLP
jgi:ribonuclease HII